MLATYLGLLLVLRLEGLEMLGQLRHRQLDSREPLVQCTHALLHPGSEPATRPDVIAMPRNCATSYCFCAEADRSDNSGLGKAGNEFSFAPRALFW